MLLSPVFGPAYDPSMKKNRRDQMRDLSLLTWKEIKEIDKEKSVVFAVMHLLKNTGGICRWQPILSRESTGVKGDEAH